MPSLAIETAKTAEIGLKRVQRQISASTARPITPATTISSSSSRPAISATGISPPAARRHRAAADLISQRDAIFRGAEVAWQWDVVPLGPGIFGVDGQYDTVRATFTDGSNVPRMPPQRVGGGAYWRNDNWFVRMGLLHAFAADRHRRVRDADRRLQSAQGGDRAQKILEAFAVGTGRGHDRARRRQPARCRYAQLRAVPQGRNPAARAQLQVLRQRQVRRRTAERPARHFKAPNGAPVVLQGADHGGVELERVLSRRQCRLQRGNAPSPARISATPRPATRCSGATAPTSSRARSSASKPATTG